MQSSDFKVSGEDERSNRELSSFRVTLQNLSQSNGASAGSIPQLQFGVESDIVLDELIQDGTEQFSEVWLANAGTTPVVLKLFIPSKFPLPTVGSVKGMKSYRSPQDMAVCQYEAYTSLAEFQGSYIPYCFGKFKLSMPWEEQADALVLEYIPRQFSEVMTNGAFPTSEEYFSLYKQTLAFIDMAHAKGVVHRDIAPRNMLFDEEHARVVFIDWRNDISVDPHVHAGSLAPLRDVRKLTSTFLDIDIQQGNAPGTVIVRGRLAKNVGKLGDCELRERLVECARDPDFERLSQQEINEA